MKADAVPTETRRVWNPIGGEIIGKSLLVEVDEISPEKDEPEISQDSEAVLVSLLVTGRLGVDVSGQTLKEGSPISKETIEQLVQVGRAAISARKQNVEAIREQSKQARQHARTSDIDG